MMPRARLLCIGVYLLALASVLVAFPGCGKRPFSIIESRACKTVDSSGQPGPQAAVFTAEDETVYVWFRYAGATAGQKLKVKFAHVDDAGNRTEQEIQTDLKAGESVGHAQMGPREGAKLTPGDYEAQIANESDIGYGAPLKFTVE